MSEAELRLWLADALVVAGVAIMTVGVYGMWWMPDLYTRLHAASKAVFLGVIPMLLATALVGDPEVGPRALLIAAFLLLTTPVSAHAIARAAYLAGERMETPGAIDESGHLRPARDGDEPAGEGL
ncbi:MAG: monovalent cation/H(+) antiporter subunit G [Chloroflexota bacterium]